MQTLEVTESTSILTKLPVQSVPITTKVLSLNPVHVEVYLIQHHVIKFVSDRASGFPPGTPVCSTNKTDCHVITEILLNTTNQTNLNSNYTCIGYI